MDFISVQLSSGSREDAEKSVTLVACGIDAVLSLVPLALHTAVIRQLSLDLLDRMALPGALIDEALNFLLDQAARVSAAGSMPMARIISWLRLARLQLPACLPDQMEFQCR
jgi:hypothetical protein